MAFSHNVKEELAKRIRTDTVCADTILLAGLAFGGHFDPCDIHMYTHSEMYASFLCDRFSMLTSMPAVCLPAQVERGRWRIAITDPAACDGFLSWLRSKKFDPEIRRLHPSYWSDDACRRAALRSFFLAGGSIGDPLHGYHLEFACRFSAPIDDIFRILEAEGMHPHRTTRGQQHILYMKDGGEIAEFLLVSGAHMAYLSFESLRVDKDMRNTVTRMVNCDTANSSRVAMASARQLEQIRVLAIHPGLNSLPNGLQEAAQARLDHPEWSIQELGEAMVPPIGKSGMSHRLRKLEKLARELNNEAAHSTEDPQG